MRPRLRAPTRRKPIAQRRNRRLRCITLRIRRRHNTPLPRRVLSRRSSRRGGQTSPLSLHPRATLTRVQRRTWLRGRPASLPTRQRLRMRALPVRQHQGRGRKNHLAEIRKKSPPWIIAGILALASTRIFGGRFETWRRERWRSANHAIKISIRVVAMRQDQLGPPGEPECSWLTGQ